MLGNNDDDDDAAIDVHDNKQFTYFYQFTCRSLHKRTASIRGECVRSLNRWLSPEHEKNVYAKRVRLAVPKMAQAIMPTDIIISLFLLLFLFTLLRCSLFHFCIVFSLSFALLSLVVDCIRNIVSLIMYY